MKVSSIEGTLPDGRWITVADPNVSIDEQKHMLDAILIAKGKLQLGKRDVQLTYVHRREGDGFHGIVKRKQFALK